MAEKERPLPQALFEQSFEYGPKTAFVLMIFDDHSRVLLSKRAIEPCNGSWHLPGSFLDKDETFKSCLERVADEVGIPLNPAELRFLGVYNNLDGDERGHIVDNVFGVQLDGGQPLNSPSKEAAETRFFSPEDLPGDIGFGHERTIQKIYQTIEAAGGKFEEVSFPLLKDFFHELG